MSNEAEFIGGLIVKAPNENAPEYVKAKLSIKRLEMIAYLQTLNDDWVNADIKVSQGGKWYAAKDNWKPQGGASRQPQQQRSAAASNPFDDVPFD